VRGGGGRGDVKRRKIVSSERLACFDDA